MVDRRKVSNFSSYLFFSERKMRNKLRILTDARRRRRQVLLVLTLVTSAVHFGADVGPCRAWSLPRPQGWFNLMLNAPIYNYDPYWREHFRMSQRTFQFVVNLKFRNSMEKRDTRCRSVVQYTQTESNGLAWQSVSKPLVKCISLRGLKLFS